MGWIKLRRRKVDDEKDQKFYATVEAQDSVSLLDFLTDARGFDVNVFEDTEAIDIIGPSYTSTVNTLVVNQEIGADDDSEASEEEEDENGGGLLGARQLEVAVIDKPSTRTPILVECAARGHARMVELLLQFGAMPDAGDAYGVTPLMAAAAGGHTPALEMIMEGLQKMVVPSLLYKLLDCTCQVVRNGVVVRDLSGRSALLIAAARLEARAFGMLLSIGASTQVVDSGGMTCLHLAVTTTASLAKHARELRNAANVSREIAKTVTKEREAIAAEEEKTKSAERARSRSPGQRLMGFVKGKNKTNEQDPLIASAEKTARHAEGKANKIEKTARDATRKVLELMHLACEMYHVMDAEVRNHNRSTLLHLAARDGVEDLTLALIVEKGFEVDSVDDQGRTPLHLACANGHLASATILLQHGASPHALTFALATPIALAAKAIDVTDASKWMSLFEIELGKRKQAQIAENNRKQKEKEINIERKIENARRKRLGEPELEELPKLISTSSIDDKNSSTPNGKLTKRNPRVSFPKLNKN